MARSRCPTVRGWAGGSTRGWVHDQPAVFLVCAAAAIVFAVVSGTNSRWVPAAAVVLLILAAAYIMRLRYLLVYYLVLAASVAVSAVLRRRRSHGRRGVARVSGGEVHRRWVHHGPAGAEPRCRRNSGRAGTGRGTRRW